MKRTTSYGNMQITHPHEYLNLIVIHFSFSFFFIIIHRIYFSEVYTIKVAILISSLIARTPHSLTTASSASQLNVPAHNSQSPLSGHQVLHRPHNLLSPSSQMEIMDSINPPPKCVLRQAITPSTCNLVSQSQPHTTILRQFSIRLRSNAIFCSDLWDNLKPAEMP